MSISPPPSCETALFENDQECIVKGQLEYDSLHVLVNGLWHYKREKPGQAIVSLSTQFGCPVHCSFCRVPRFRGNITPVHAIEQTRIMLEKALEYGIFPGGIRSLKIAMVKAGDALLNPHLSSIVSSLIETFRATYGSPKFKISTIFPKTELSRRNMESLVAFAENYAVEDGIISPQISLHATDDGHRQRIAGMPLAPLSEISDFGELWQRRVGRINGRKPTLAFTLNDDSAAACDPSDLASILAPDRFVILIRGIVADASDCLSERRYSNLSERFLREGYTVIDGRATPLEIQNKTEVGLYRLLSGVSYRKKT